MAVKGRSEFSAAPSTLRTSATSRLPGRRSSDFDLERLLVLVIADPGHKETKAPAHARLELTRLAFEDVPGVDVELDSHARTVDSLEARRPRDAFFIIGGGPVRRLLAMEAP